MTPPPRLLVIGGSGFIGQYVVSRAVYRGWQVTSLGLNIPTASRVTAGVHYITADLTQVNLLRQFRDNRFDYVVNLGGYVEHTLFGSGGRRLILSHFDGLLNLLEFLDRSVIKRFVQIGSSDEYGDMPHPQHEGLREHPISPYSLGKVASTHFLQMLQRTEGFPAVILRLFLTYGPRQDEHRFLPQIILGCLGNHEFPVSEGAQLRDFCYVEDVVDAIFCCFDCQGASGEVINIASGEPRSIRDMIEHAVRLIGSGRPQFGEISYRAHENMALYADISLAKRILGWAPQTSLENGLNVTIEWFRACHASA